MYVNKSLFDISFRHPYKAGHQKIVHLSVSQQMATTIYFENYWLKSLWCQLMPKNKQKIWIISMWKETIIIDQRVHIDGLPVLWKFWLKKYYLLCVVKPHQHYTLPLVVNTEIGSAKNKIENDGRKDKKVTNMYLWFCVKLGWFLFTNERNKKTIHQSRELFQNKDDITKWNLIKHFLNNLQISFNAAFIFYEVSYPCFWNSDVDIKC